MTCLQNLLQLSLLLHRQTRGELDVAHNHEVAPHTRILAVWHAEARERFLGARLCRTGFLELDLLAVNGSDCSSPAGQSFLEFESDCVENIVAVASIEDMWFLFCVS